MRKRDETANRLAMKRPVRAAEPERRREPGVVPQAAGVGRRRSGLLCGQGTRTPARSNASRGYTDVGHTAYSFEGRAYDNRIFRFLDDDRQRSLMHEGSCHCGAVRLTLPSTPEVATD